MQEENLVHSKASVNDSYYYHCYHQPFGVTEVGKQSGRAACGVRYGGRYKGPRKLSLLSRWGEREKCSGKRNNNANNYKGVPYKICFKVALMLIHTVQASE